MADEKNYLNSMDVPKLRTTPVAPHNVRELQERQNEVSDFINIVKDTMVVPDEDIPEIHNPQVMQNRWQEKQLENQDPAVQREVADEGADKFDDRPKYEAYPKQQPQPGGDRGQSHHGSKHSVLKPVRRGVRDYEDGITVAAKQVAAQPHLLDVLGAGLPKLAATYYNSHGQTTPFKEMRRIEVKERGNYSDKQWKTWQRQYNIGDNQRVIWVTQDVEDVKRYMDDPDDESYNTYTDAEGFIIPESDDGDGGYLFVFNGTSASLVSPVASTGVGFPSPKYELCLTADKSDKKPKEPVESTFFDPNSTKNEGRKRLRDPQDFDNQTFRRWSTWEGQTAPAGVQFLTGDLKTGERALQTIRFDLDQWDAPAAQEYFETVVNTRGFEKQWVEADWKTQFPDYKPKKDYIKKEAAVASSHKRSVLDTTKSPKDVFNPLADSDNVGVLAGYQITADVKGKEIKQWLTQRYPDIPWRVRSSSGKSQWIEAWVPGVVSVNDPNVIPNELRKEIIEKIIPGAQVSDWNDIRYGNIAHNRIALMMSDWEAVMGTSLALPESVGDSDTAAFMHQPDAESTLTVDARINPDLRGADPAAYFEKPIIGRITVRSPFGTGEEEYEVIGETARAYICNQWYKEYKKEPQLIAKDAVNMFESIDGQLVAASKVVEAAAPGTWNITEVKYNPELNAVEEHTVYSSRAGADIAEQVFQRMTDAGSAVYLWFAGEAAPEVLATTPEYTAEFDKVRD